MKKNRIYLDNAAGTKLDKSVQEKMVEVMEVFGNPSSLHKEGRMAKKILYQSRVDVAKILNCDSSEIIFTGSGTESDNLAIFGVARAYQKINSKNKGHIITTKIEHHAVLHSMEELEREGFSVSYLNINKKGLIDLKEFKKALQKDTILVSLVYANNEIGTTQPISEIAKILKNYRKNQQKKVRENLLPIFHIDACQAINYLNIDVQKLGIDLMTFSGSKIYGPKGIGCLYKKESIKLKPLVFGGGQENNFRSGTENIFLIAGLSEALKITEQKKVQEAGRLKELRDYFKKNLSKKIKNISFNGCWKNRLPNNINISIAGVEGESLLLYLDEKGIAVSTGSACSSQDLQSSHVLRALNIPIESTHGSLRFTLGRESNKDDLDYVLKILPEIVKKLRDFSPCV